MVVWLRVPLMPVMVRLYIPVGVVLPVVTDIEEVVLIGLGAKVAPAPPGSPPALSVTLPVNPTIAATVTVYVVLRPCVTVRLDGLAESE